MSLQKSFNLFDGEFRKMWKKYVELHKELDKFRGIEINEKNVEVINKLIMAIQERYAAMHDILHWIQSWNLHAIQAINEHKKFMDDIKASGAMPENEVVQKDANEKEAHA